MPDASPQTLPQSVIASSLDPRNLQYLTRGLTSRIYTCSLVARDGERAHAEEEEERRRLIDTLHSYRADRTRLAVKCVDIEEQPRPHDIHKEIRILALLGKGQDDRSQYIMRLLHVVREEPDDFTTIDRLYLPFYPSLLTHAIAHNAYLSTVAAASTQSSPVHFAIRIASQLFQALAFLHDEGIAHRDVKPSNLLLTASAEDATSSDEVQIRLCDFGTAFEDSNSSSSSSASANEAPVREGQASRRPSTCSTSTHPYTPPELLFSPTDGYDGGAVDVWEAACVVAEILGHVVEDQSPAQPSRHLRAAALGVGSAQDGNGDINGHDDNDEDDDPFGSVGLPARRQEEQREEWHRAEAQLWQGSDGSDGDDDDNEDEDSDGDVFNDRVAMPLSKRQKTSQSQTQMQQQQQQQRRKAYRRQALFHLGSQSDLSLASAIFEFLGLPEADRDDLWPESTHFRPPLARFPFPRRAPPAQPQTLYSRLPSLIPQGEEQEEAPPELHSKSRQALTEALLGCLKLSASQRWTAQHVVERLQGFV